MPEPGPSAHLVPRPQVLSRLIRGYNYRFQPRSHALDLVECLHIVLSMLDRLAASGASGGAQLGLGDGMPPGVRA